MAIAAVAAVRPAVSYKALDLGAGAAIIGAVAGSFALFSLFASIPAGLLIDRHGARLFFLIGAGTIAVASVADATAAAVAVLPLGQALLGLGHLGVQLSTQASAARDEGAERRDQRFARNAVAVSIGQLAGPLAGGWILELATRAELRNPTTPVFVFGLAMATIAALVASRGTTWARGTAPSGRARPAGGFVDMVRSPGMPPAMAASVAVLTAIDLLVAYLPVIGAERGMSPAFVGLLLSLRGVATLASRLALPSLISSLGRRTTLTANLWLAGAATAGLAVATEEWMFLALVAAIGFGVGVGQPITASWVAGQAPAGRVAAALALRITGNRLGQLLIPGVAGLLAGVGGPATVFAAGAATLLGSALSVRNIGLDP